jgi:chromosome segregation ATPase
LGTHADPQRGPGRRLISHRVGPKPFLPRYLLHQTPGLQPVQQRRCRLRRHPEPRGERLRGEQLEEAKEEASEAWERANETQRTKQGLRRELASAESQAAEAKERLSEAGGALAMLRPAYDARKARGRWARLRAA